MRRIEAAVLAVGAAFLCLNALFPPRWNPANKNLASRQFILADDFYRTESRPIEAGPLKGWASYEDLTLHYDRFVMLSAVIGAATICVAGLLRCLLGSTRQVPGRSDVSPTTPAR